MPRRNTCRLYIHLAFTYSVNPLSIVWSELGPAPLFPPMRVLEVLWPWAHSLVCEVVLSSAHCTRARALLTCALFQTLKFLHLFRHVPPTSYTGMPGQDSRAWDHGHSPEEIMSQLCMQQEFHDSIRGFVAMIMIVSAQFSLKRWTHLQTICLYICIDLWLEIAQS